jgi:hypothetical protein
VLAPLSVIWLCFPCGVLNHVTFCSAERHPSLDRVLPTRSESQTRWTRPALRREGKRANDTRPHNRRKPSTRVRTRELTCSYQVYGPQCCCFFCLSHADCTDSCISVRSYPVGISGASLSSASLQTRAQAFSDARRYPRSH